MIATTAIVMHLRGDWGVHGRHRNHHILSRRCPVIWIDYCYELCVWQSVSERRSRLILLRLIIEGTLLLLLLNSFHLMTFWGRVIIWGSILSIIEVDELPSRFLKQRVESLLYVIRVLRIFGLLIIIAERHLRDMGLWFHLLMLRMMRGSQLGGMLRRPLRREFLHHWLEMPCVSYFLIRTALNLVWFEPLRFRRWRFLKRVPIDRRLLNWVKI